MQMILKKYNFLLLIIAVFLIGSIVGYVLGKPNLSENNQFNPVKININEIIDYNEGLPITKEIYDNCSKESNATTQILCVKEYTKAHYNYSYRDEIYSVDDMFSKGADCKSYSIYYATLAKMLGYNYVILQLKDHVMTVIYHDTGYCVLDQDIGNCINYNGELE